MVVAVGRAGFEADLEFGQPGEPLDELFVGIDLASFVNVAVFVENTNRDVRDVKVESNVNILGLRRLVKRI